MAESTKDKRAYWMYPADEKAEALSLDKVKLREAVEGQLIARAAQRIADEIDVDSVLVRSDAGFSKSIGLVALG